VPHKFTITLSDAPHIIGGPPKCQIEFSPAIEKVLREVGKAGKATPAEEYFMVAYEALTKYNLKATDARERKKLKDLGILRPHIPQLVLPPGASN
jgi:hypothetical protein